jgi:hypothetical protein
MMRLIGVALCAVLALGACGGGRSVKETASNQLEGIQSFLTARFNQSSGAVEGGGLCGDPALVGDVVGAVPSSTPGCGVANAVSLRAVGNVTLTQPATMNCQTAQALKTWIDTGVKPAIGKRGGGVSSLRVAAHYVCRTRNHKKGAKISEHGKGKAIDISAINLADGTSITLLEGWRSRKDGKALRQMHKAACGPFGTVLGPESDRHHQDHFHFDTASHRGGPYCR